MFHLLSLSSRPTNLPSQPTDLLPFCPTNLLPNRSTILPSQPTILLPFGLPTYYPADLQTHPASLLNVLTDLNILCCLSWLVWMLKLGTSGCLWKIVVGLISLIFANLIWQVRTCPFNSGWLHAVSASTNVHFASAIEIVTLRFAGSSFPAVHLYSSYQSPQRLILVYRFLLCIQNNCTLRLAHQLD